MKRIFIVFILSLITVIAMSSDKYKFHRRFVERFNKPTSKYFNISWRKSGVDNRYFQGIDSPTERRTKIMLYLIDPEDPAGPGRGPEIISKNFTHFGVYSVRIRVPDVAKTQPNIGAVVGYFTYFDSIAGISEIDFEWLLADPEIVYVGTWTGDVENPQRVGRTINLAKGIIYHTVFEHGSTLYSLEGVQNQPETIKPIENYNASSQFYTYGFEWYPDRVRWWIIHPVTSEKIVLWDYSGSTVGIPQGQSRYRVNFWHTHNWSVETKPNSTEKPLYPYEVEIDWVSYTPYKRLKK